MTPQVIITGTIQDIFGNADAAASITFELVNFGNNIPVVSGTSILGLTKQTATVNGSGVFSVTLYGNDVITPSGTFYIVSFFSSLGVLLKQVPYSFTGSGSFDLSTLSPLTNVQGVAPNLNPVLTNPTGSQTIAGFPLTASAFNISTRGDRQIILQNPDFEGSSIVPPPGWFENAPASFTFTGYETATPAPGKLQSLKFTTSLGSSVRSTTAFSVVPGDIYSVSCIAKSDGVTGQAACGLRFGKADGSSAGTFTAPANATTSWLLQTVSITVPANAVNARLILVNNDTVSTSSVWFDQISVRKLDFPAALSAPVYTRTTRGDRHIILQNPDFENSSLIPPPGWSAGSNGTLSYETTSPAPSKLQSLKISTTSQFGGTNALDIFSVVSGESYSLQCVAKSDGSGQAVVTVNFLDKLQNFIGSVSASTSSTSWTALTAAGTVPASAIQAVLVLSNNSVTQPSAVWFDQFIVNRTTVNAGRLLVNGTAVSSASCTGAGSTGIVAIAANSTDSFGELLIEASGISPASSGTITLTLSSALGASRAVGLFLPMSTDTAWNPRASFQQTSTSTTSVVLNWDNNGVALVAGSNYRVAYCVFGR